jgi:hypothetical protein
LITPIRTPMSARMKIKKAISVFLNAVFISFSRWRINSTWVWMRLNQPEYVLSLNAWCALFYLAY